MKIPTVRTVPDAGTGGGATRRSAGSYAGSVWVLNWLQIKSTLLYCRKNGYGGRAGFRLCLHSRVRRYRTLSRRKIQTGHRLEGREDVEGRCVCHGLQTLDLFTSVALTRFFTFHLQAPAENLSLFSSLSFFFFFSLIPVGVSV